ncbi:MAG: hypothetical protein IJD04_01575, partial [Desulfovibrionaceae bacterium]|nr:hypothetical protein [Desulfovibrionaceae bacterium]
AGADELVEILKEAPARLTVREPDLEELLGNDLLQAAMYSARDGSLGEFAARVHEEGAKASKSFFPVSVSGELEGIEFRLPSDTVLHQGKKHPDISLEDWERLPEVLAQLSSTNTTATGRYGQYGVSFIGTTDIAGTAYGISFSLAQNGTVYINTFFKDSPNKIKKWVQSEREKASKGREDEALATALEPRFTLGKPSELSLRQLLESVKGSDGKTYFQFIGEQGVNRKKAAQWASSSRLQLPWVGTHLSGKKTVFTEEDLVKLKEQNSGYYQGMANRALVVHGDELGVPEGADIREYRKAARKVYRQLQSSPAYRADLGEIKFTRAGWDEAAYTGADPRKWKLIPRLKELVENAEYIRRTDLNKPRKDKTIAFHWLEADVILDGEHLRIGINVAEDGNGNKFYSLNQDLNDWAGKYKAPDNRSGKSNPGAQELYQDVNTSAEKTIEQAGDNVNLHILPQEGREKARLAADIAAWSAEVDRIAASGRPPSGPVQMLAQTPLVMQLLGTDSITGRAAIEGGIYAAPHLFDGSHPNITSAMLKQIPAAMVNPIAIFDSDSPAGRAQGDIVFMLELTDSHSATVVVPVTLAASGKAGAIINIAKSAYAKEKQGNPSDSWFEKQVNKNARYLNGQKWALWASARGSDSPLVAHNASGNNIYTELDLGKLRNQYPGMYQPAGRAAMAGKMRGGLSISPDNQYIITLFKDADLSTLLHETGHIFLEEMERI